MKNNMLQNLETVRKKELPPVKPADSPIKFLYMTRMEPMIQIRWMSGPHPLPTARA